MFLEQNQQKFHDYLLEKNLLTQEQYDQCEKDYRETDRPINEILLGLNFLPEDVLAKNYSDFYQIPFINLVEKTFTEDLLNRLPAQLATKLQTIPFLYDEPTNTLHVAMKDPLDLNSITFLEKKTGLHINPYVTVLSELQRLIDEHYGKSLKEDISAALEEISQTTLKLDTSSPGIEVGTLKDAPIARVVGVVLETAVKSGASDIHIEPSEQETRVRYRVDGILQEKQTFPKEMHDSVIARIKVLANMKIDEKRIPQDGRFKVQVGTSSTDLRVSSLPTVDGEKIVIRLLKEEGNIFTFKDLGLRGLSLMRLEEALLKSNGIVLVTGPTGSGKTVTLASALSKLNTSKVNIVTLEDPVEVRVKGVNQVQINPMAGLNFSTGLRSFLRQDPNIIMVGEIRDGETAELAIHAALTGHLVLSTLHTNSAAGAIPRMIDMGVENFLLASTLNAVLAQRLVGKVCQNCKEYYDPPKELLQEIETVLGSIEDSQVLLSRDKGIADTLKAVKSHNIKLCRGKGCEKCNSRGYKGRTGIFELLEVSQAISDQTLADKTDADIEATARKEGMLTLIQDGYLKAVEGITTLEEVMRVARE